ncbi:hypothetical protein [Microcoleus sp. PH2017_28_MFU_U_A]|uniref:hypothetical protein n=1 Tax=Microcoleus sp. PH2017_28_MFU_U_A TaxID=2798838 RepID=UPI001E04FE74|nr:hypothetical protein [Microcoleus sp. PH2017_28_MFU_U_A]MCC3593854.1 hypothetical protein [Microcoleus sp. PH2017_28_MFU_U_A]
MARKTGAVAEKPESTQQQPLETDNQVTAAVAVENPGVYLVDLMSKANQKALFGDKGDRPNDIALAAVVNDAKGVQKAATEAGYEVKGSIDTIGRVAMKSLGVSAEPGTAPAVFKTQHGENASRLDSALSMVKENPTPATTTDIHLKVKLSAPAAYEAVCPPSIKQQHCETDSIRKINKEIQEQSWKSSVEGAYALGSIQPIQDSHLSEAAARFSRIKEEVQPKVDAIPLNSFVEWAADAQKLHRSPEYQERIVNAGRMKVTSDALDTKTLSESLKQYETSLQQADNGKVHLKNERQEGRPTLAAVREYKEEMKAAHYEAMPKQWDVIQQYMSKDRESAAKLQALPAKSKSSAELGG